LKKPIKDILKTIFTKNYFKKVLKVLKYMKLLDEKSIGYGDNANGFSFTIDFANN
jgi:hypothetical protein